MLATINGIAVECTVEEFALLSAMSAPAKKAPAKPKATKPMPEGLKAAKKHCYERRMVRREMTELGGLTHEENSLLWAAHPELHPLPGQSKTPEQIEAWAVVKVAYKLATR